MNVQQAIADFLQHGQAVRNLSDRTLRAYQSDLTQFHSHVDGANMVDITPEHLETYLDKLGTGPYRDTSIRRKVAALKVFFRYLEEQGVVTESPARKLKIKRPVENRVPTVLSNREVETPALFVGRSGTRLTIYSIENIFKKHVRLAEIKRHITPHALRHTMAAMLVSSGTDIHQVQEILGHASILSTQVYTKLPIQKGRRTAIMMPPEMAPRIPIKKT